MCSCPPLFQFVPPPPFVGSHALFCPPVKAIHAVTIMRLKAIGLQLSVHTMLTSRQVCQFSPNFSRTIGSEAIEKWEGKDLFSPPCIEIWRALALPALQLVPPLSK